MRTAIARILLAAAGAALLLAGLSCGKLTGVVRPHTPPETTIFVSGPLDSVNHVVHLYWYGSDANGYVTGYEVRLLNPAAPADSAWVHTTRTDSLLTVLTPAGFTSPVFEVRAIDNDDARDPTPARQLFQFTNQPPVVRITLRPGTRDTTFASVTVAWSTLDVDGDATRVRYLVWLDGQEASPIPTTETTFTMPSDRFLVAGQYTSGPRTLYVRGIDDGGMAGPIDSVTWQVKRPVTGPRARLLIVDDLPRTNASNPRTDTLYANTAARNLPAGSYTILRLDYNQPFDSAKDIEQTFRQFEAVVWYRGSVTAISNPLRDYQDGIGAYLEAGGRFYLEGLYLIAGINAPGALREDFAQRYLDCDRLLKNFQQAPNFTDSTAGWGNVKDSLFYSTMFSDSTKQQGLPVQSGEAGGIRVFKVRSSSTIALAAPAATLTPSGGQTLPVGVSVPQPGGGRAVIMTLPLSDSQPAGASAAPRFLAKIFAQLGLTGP